MEIVDSARKRGIPDRDIRHPVDNAIRVHVMDGYLMFVGPAQAGQLLEIGYNPTTDRIFHVCPPDPST